MQPPPDRRTGPDGKAAMHGRPRCPTARWQGPLGTAADQYVDDRGQTASSSISAIQPPCGRTRALAATTDWGGLPQALRNDPPHCTPMPRTTGNSPCRARSSKLSHGTYQVPPPRSDRFYRQRGVETGRAIAQRCQGLFGPDGLAVGGVAGAPALGELGDEEEAAAALVVVCGAAQIGAGAAAVGDLADQGAVADQPQLDRARRRAGWRW